MATNLQTFSGEVEIPEGNLQLKRILELSTNNASTSNTGILFSRNLGSTSNSNVIVYFDEATDSLRFGHTLNASSDSEIIMDSANVLNVNVFGEVEASYFKGDGGLLSNLVTDLQSVTENGAETDQTLVLTNAVTGIDVQTGNVNVAGNVTASIFFGDGGLLSNITQTLQGITEIGNTTSIALEFNNVTTGFVTTSNVGIVNTAPQHNFSVGSNLYVHDTASNVLTVEGNVSAHRLTLGAIEITPAYGLENVTNISNLAYDTLLFQNASTAFVTTAMAGIGLQPDSSDVGTSGLHVDGHLRLGGQADNTDNELMYIKSAGALGVLANESDTNNTNTDLRLQSGETYNSNITMVGKNSAQYMTFGTNTAERMRIDSSGNVGIGTESPSYKLDVHGTANVGALYSTLTYSNASANIVAWNSSTNEIIDSGLEKGFTEHPVEAMTNPIHYAEGHGTYEADASSKSIWFHSSFGSPFDYVIENNMWESDANWSSSNVYNNANWTTDVGGTRHYGEWLQLKNPYAITLAYTDVYPRALSTNGTSRGPGAGVILGSNDGENWYKLTEFSGKTYTNGVATKIDVNATTPYTWYRIVTSKLANATAIDTRVDIGEWRLFAEKPVTRMQNVHISGELSSETLQTGYIKWPKVPLKANESEGYKVKYSSKFSGKEPYKAFNNSTQIGDDAWITGYNYTSGVANTGASDPQMNGIYGDWLELECPREFVVSYIQFYNRNDVNYRSPKKGRFYGSNDGITFTQLLAWSNLSIPNNSDAIKLNINATNAYKIYRIQIEEMVGAGDHAAIGELQLFEAATGVGAAPTSAKLQVAGSLGMAKGVEFFAGDDVVMELPKHDRPLTRYPEINMTSSSSGGYVVTASSYLGNSPHLCFDGSSATHFHTQYPYYTENGGTYDPGQTAVGGGVPASGTTLPSHELVSGYAGEYITLQLPKKIKPAKVEINTRADTSLNLDQTQSGEELALVGSNDGSTWEVITTHTVTKYPDDNVDPYFFPVSTTKYYKHLGLICTNTGPVDSIYNTAWTMSNLRFWGYEEGDTSVDVVHRSIPNKPSPQHLEVFWDAADSNSYSFANSSNVYDLSGNGVKGTITGTNGFDAEYNAWVFDGSGDYIQKTSINSQSGNWIHSISTWIYFNDLVTSKVFSIDPPSYLYGGHNETSAFFARSTGFIWDFGMQNNNSTTLVPQKNRWYHVTLVADGTGYKKIYIDNNLQSSFSYSNNTNINMQTGATLNIGEGNLNGSIANFRLFSKALSADQVRELYEYDAPRFGHRQNLVSLHKGNLGVGVAHPTSRFEVAGADGVQEYPPKAMTGDETYMEGHGVFRVSASTDAYAHSGFAIWKAFNKVQGNEGWHSGEGYVYGGSTSPSSYITNAGGSVFDTANVYQQIGGIYGQWIKLECPQRIVLKSIVLQNRSLSTIQAPKDFTLLGSNNDGDWEIIKSYTGVSSSTSGVTHIVNAKESYKYFVLVVTRVQTTITSDAVIGEWRLFGTPAPSAIEDGHLTLGKALTLPRVSGHATGAETPRAESLVLHYDTTVDSVVSGSTVVDISGNGLNGTLGGDAAYSSTERAFTFDGTDDYLYQSGISGWSDNISHTTSFWFKILSPSSGYAGGIYQIYNNVSTTNNYSAVALVTGSSGYVSFYHFSNDYQYDIALSAGIWYHMVTVYPGSPTTQKVYINGENVPLTSSSGISVGSNLVLGTSPKLSIGGDIGRNNYYTDGSISNFKIWNVALTAEEVAMEYALGRTGKALNLTDTALCLGGTVPRAQLDVRGSAMIDGGLVIKYKNSIEYARDGGIMLSRAGLGNATNKYSSQPIVLSGGDSGAIDGNIRGGAIWSQWGGAQYGVAVRGASLSDTYPYLQDPALFVTKDKVGIGLPNPQDTLHVAGNIEQAWNDHRVALIYRNDGGNNYRMGMAYNTGIRELQIFSTSADGSGGEIGFYTRRNAYGTGDTDYGTKRCKITTGVPTTFTGQHRCILSNVSPADVINYEGMIVSSNKNKYIKLNNGVATGANAITINESIPLVSLSTEANDKSCFGVISASEDPDSREETNGNMVSIFEKELGDTRVFINSLGEGAMWVTNINGSLESGDYITTSNVAGYGQKQDSEFLANYTVAKITMDCDFNPVTQPIQIIKKELANVNYWVKTTYSNVSVEEYSNLTEENRTTELETYYTKEVERKYRYKPTVTVTSEDPWDDVYIMPFATYAEWSNLEANVQNTYTLTYMQNDFDSTRYEKTTVSNVSGDDVWDTVDISPYISYDEWSNLEANVQNTFTITYMQSVTTTCTEEAFSNLTVEEQNTYTLVYTKTVTEEVSEPEGADEHTRTIYKKIEREETKNEPTEDTGEWVLDVRQELVNVLDEHGQLQWEDDPSGATEKAYKIRYLDASGQQTDEANAVHIAAFVGCTYHCG
jgi:hypothetical protein